MNHIGEFPKSIETETNSSLLSARLKEATWDLHHQVEHGSEVNRRIVTKVRGEGEEADRERESYREAYEHFLRAAYGFEHSVQSAVFTFGMTHDLAELGYPVEEADAAGLIRADIMFLNESEQSLDSPSYFPPIRTVAELAGVEYVRRGSRNGNAYIAHAVRGNIGLGSENGAAYLNLDQGKTRPNWEKFKGWLDSLTLDEHEIEQAIEAAKATFIAVGKWHTESSPQAVN